MAFASTYLDPPFLSFEQTYKAVFKNKKITPFWLDILQHKNSFIGLLKAEKFPNFKRDIQ